MKEVVLQAVARACKYKMQLLLTGFKLSCENGQKGVALVFVCTPICCTRFSSLTLHSFSVSIRLRFSFLSFIHLLLSSYKQYDMKLATYGSSTLPAR